MKTINNLLKKVHCQFIKKKNQLIVFVLLIAGLQFFGQYIPPIGIPAPEFGIDEQQSDYYTRPNPWIQEVSGWYYIDQYHTNASNNNTYGTPNNPRLTIPEPIPSGSVVEINGIYDFAPTGYDLITANGTQVAPVFIIGNSQTVVMRKWVLKSSYTIVENIEFTNLGKVIISYPSHHVSIRNSNLHDMAGKIGGSGVSDSERNHHIVIYNNQIHSQDGWNQNPDIDLDNHGIKFGRYVEDVWVLDNLAYNNGGSFIQVGDWNNPANNEMARWYYIGRNTAYANRQSPIGIKQSSDVIISENHLYNNHAIQTNAAGQAGVVFQYGSDNLWIINNHIHNSNAGISSGSNSGGVGQEQYIINNLIYNIHTAVDYVYNPESAWSPAAVMLAGGINRYVVNNTIYDVDAGINCPSGSGLLHITGNIISNVSKANHIFIEFYSTANSSTVYNNLFYQNTNDIKIRWGNNTLLNLETFENTYPSTSDENINLNPLFTDVFNNNFQLQSIPIPSPAIDSGIESDIYQTFYNLYGIDMKVDNNGNLRSQGLEWDIGAYEYESTLSNNDETIDTTTISISPNPTYDTLTVNLDDDILKKVIIYNELGQYIKEATTKEVTILNLAKGVYFVKIILQSGKEITKKIIKN